MRAAHQQDGTVEGGGGGSSGRQDADADRAPLRPVACPLHCTIASTRRQHTAVDSRPRAPPCSVGSLCENPRNLGSSAHPSWHRAWGRYSAGPYPSAAGIVPVAGPLGTEKAVPPSGLGASVACWRHHAVAAPSFAWRASTGSVAASSCSSPVVRAGGRYTSERRSDTRTQRVRVYIGGGCIRELGSYGRACWRGACLR